MSHGPLGGMGGENQAPGDPPMPGLREGAAQQALPTLIIKSLFETENMNMSDDNLITVNKLGFDRNLYSAFSTMMGTHAGKAASAEHAAGTGRCAT